MSAFGDHLPITAHPQTGLHSRPISHVLPVTMYQSRSTSHAFRRRFAAPEFLDRLIYALEYRALILQAVDEFLKHHDAMAAAADERMARVGVRHGGARD